MIIGRLLVTPSSSEGSFYQETLHLQASVHNLDLVCRSGAWAATRRTKTKESKLKRSWSKVRLNLARPESNKKASRLTRSLRKRKETSRLTRWAKVDETEKMVNEIKEKVFGINETIEVEIDVNKDPENFEFE